MPVYKNRPYMDPDTQVWRYFSLEALIATMRDRQLRFTRVDTFEDPFEGSVPKQQIDDQVVLFGNAYQTRTMYASVEAHYPSGAMSVPEWQDRWTKTTRLRRAMTRSTHACCWAAGDESEALWRLYCTDDGIRCRFVDRFVNRVLSRVSRQRPRGLGVGVALRTTLAQLETSVAPHDLYVSPVTYRHYHEGPAFNDDLDSFMHKRKGFWAEKEVRLLKFEKAHFDALITKPPATTELPIHLFKEWPAADAITEIVLSPYADEPFEQRARAAIEAADPSLRDRVVLSVLNPRRYAPGF
jgi:hypothetical protein